MEMLLTREFQFIGTRTFLGAVFLKAGIPEQIALGDEIVRTRNGRNFDLLHTASQNDSLFP